MVNENPELINKIERKITDIVNKYLTTSTYNYTDLKNQIILELYPYINELTQASAISPCCFSIRYSPCIGIKYFGLIILNIHFNSSSLAWPEVWTSLNVLLV